MRVVFPLKHENLVRLPYNPFNTFMNSMRSRDQITKASLPTLIVGRISQ